LICIEVFNEVHELLCGQHQDDVVVHAVANQLTQPANFVVIHGVMYRYHSRQLERKRLLLYAKCID
jgi:hypothetical protein